MPGQIFTNQVDRLQQRLVQQAPGENWQWQERETYWQRSRTTEFVRQPNIKQKFSGSP
jgi:hypothetical protein